MSITKDGLFKYQTLNERQRKNLIILETIRKNGAISRATVAKAINYNIVTLSNHIDEYLKMGLLYEKGIDISSGGRRPVLLELNRKEFFFIGVDFNREMVKGIVANTDLKVISEAKLPRPAITQEEVKRTLIALIRQLLKEAKVEASKIRFIAIGVYGNLIEKNSTIKGLEDEKGKLRATIYFTDLKYAIENEFKIKTFFGQDASFAAFGEKAKNPIAEADSMLYIFQDIGKGVVMKGEIYCSTDISGADIEGITGNLSYEEKTKLREESSYLRPWNSQMSLRSEAVKAIESGVGTRIVELLKGNIGNLNDEIIITAASEDDEVARELIESVGINLGVRIAYLINLFSPQVVIIGGGVEKAGELLFGEIEKTVEKLSLEKARRSVKILPAVLGSEVVSIGAAYAGLRESFLEA